LIAAHSLAAIPSPTAATITIRHRQGPRALCSRPSRCRSTFGIPCGTGTIVTELRAAGHEVVATDLGDYGIPITPPGYYRVDFLLEWRAPAGCEAIVCNPPYKLAPRFVRHALTLVPVTCMLLRLAFLESTSRTDILESGQLARVFVFRKRLPMMHRRNWTGKLASNSIPFAWFVWRHDWCGDPRIKRIDITRNQPIEDGAAQCATPPTST
jgi:hypothetical protein